MKFRSGHRALRSTLTSGLLWAGVITAGLWIGGRPVTAREPDGDGRASTPASTLREAWIYHRLEGDLSAAAQRYRSVVSTESAAPDLRARAHLGLAIMARDRDDLSAALDELDRFFALPGVAPRWRDAGRVLRAELEGTAVPTARGAPPDLLRELQERVQSLQGDLERVKTTVAAREKELADKDRMLKRLEELRREATASAGAGVRTRELERSRAQDYLDGLVQDDRKNQQLRRYFIRSHLLRAREAFEGGDFLEAHNELKSVLVLDPLHREALGLAARCRALLAASAGKEEFESPEPGRWTGTPRRLVEELTTAVMRAHLAEAQRHLAGGRTFDAMQSASKVLEEYSWCPAPLPEDVVRDVVGGADRVLEQCMGSSSAEDSAQARGLRVQQLDLNDRLRRHFSQLMATERALAEADASAHQMTEGEPQRGRRDIAVEFENSMAAAARAIEARRPLDAVRHYRDMLILLEWVPELDPGGVMARELNAQLEALDRAIPVVGPESVEDPGEGESGGRGSRGGSPEDSL